MSGINERRLFSRYPAVNLMAEIDGQLFDVADISLGGLRLRGQENAERTALTFLLCPHDFGTFDRKQGVEVSANVVGCYGDTTALKFNRATMPLMKLVLRQASLELGVEPYVVK